MSKTRTHAPKQPLFALPLRSHPDAPFIVLDAAGKQLAVCGVAGDVSNAGKQIAASFVAAMNGELPEAEEDAQIARLKAALDLAPFTPIAQVVEIVLARLSPPAPASEAESASE